MKLLREIKDVRDELHMIDRILLQQEELVGKMNSAPNLHAIYSQDWTSHADDFARLDVDAERVEDSVSRNCAVVLVSKADNDSSLASWILGRSRVA
jgi:hypothetical protein